MPLEAACRGHSREPFGRTRQTGPMTVMVVTAMEDGVPQGLRRDRHSRGSFTSVSTPGPVETKRRRP
jgi:hypothetical protein